MSWYTGGVQPAGITQAEIYTIYKAQCDAMIEWQVNQSGMPADMPAGAYRVCNPDQPRFLLNGAGIDDPGYTGGRYMDGTINITNGSNQVTGTGTSFLKLLTKSIVEAKGDPIYYNQRYILSIQSNTTLTLDGNYVGPTRAGAQFRVGGGTFSEGQAYGLVNFAYRSRGNATTNPIFHANAKTIADGLIIYYKYYFNERGFSHWRINPDGTIAGTYGRNGATDSDLDYCFGLLKMHEFHGSAGAINYLAEAVAYINKIDQYEFYSSTHTNVALRDVMINGDGWDSTQSGSPDRYMMDYARMGYFTAFGVATGNTTRWAAIKAKQYEKLNYYYTNFTTGLVPNESKRDQTSLGYEYDFGFNSVRIPWDWTLDYMWNGTSTNALALNQSKRLADWSRNKWSQLPANHKATHTLPGVTTGDYASMAMMGTYMATGLVHADSAQWAGDCIKWMRDNKNLQSYFGGWLGANALLLATGEMQPYTEPTGGGVAPATPTGLGFYALSGTAIRLYWTASVGATSYGLKRSGTLAGTYTTIASGITGTFYDDYFPSLTSATKYYYKVNATNTTGTSADSVAITASTMPEEIATVTATPGNSQVTVSWTTVPRAESYVVYRYLMPGYTSQQTYPIASGTSYTDLTAVNGTAYDYSVSGIYNSLTGNAVHSGSVTPSASPPAAATTNVITMVGV